MPRTKQLQPTSKNNFDHGVRFEVSFSWKSSTNGRSFSFTRVISLRPFSFSVFLLSFFRAPFFYFISHGRGIYHERQWKFRFPRAKISEFPPRTRSSPHRFPYSCKSGSLDDIFPRTFYTSLSPIRESNPSSRSSFHTRRNFFSLLQSSHISFFLSTPRFETSPLEFHRRHSWLPPISANVHSYSAARCICRINCFVSFRHDRSMNGTSS